MYRNVSYRLDWERWASNPVTAGLGVEHPDSLSTICLFLRLLREAAIVSLFFFPAHADLGVNAVNTSRQVGIESAARASRSTSILITPQRRDIENAIDPTKQQQAIDFLNRLMYRTYHPPHPPTPQSRGRKEKKKGIIRDLKHPILRTNENIIK